MLCRNCGRELPIVGSQCPFCGASTEQPKSSVTDDTILFSRLPVQKNESAGSDTFSDADGYEEETYDHAAYDDDDYDEDGYDDDDDSYDDGYDDGYDDDGYDEAGYDDYDEYNDPDYHGRDDDRDYDSYEEDEYDEPVRTPSERYASRQKEPHTTYFEKERPRRRDIRPYRKPSLAKKIFRRLLAGVMIIGLIAAVSAGAVWFVRSRQPDENLINAEKFMKHGQFDEALSAFQLALAEAKDPAAIQLQIDQLKSFQQARAFLEDEDYTAALATLNDLKGRLTDTGTPLAKSVKEMIESARKAKEENEFQASLSEAKNEVENDNYDSAEERLETIQSDTELSTEQQDQVDEVQQEIDEEQERQEREAENEREKQEKRASFGSQINALEATDQQIAAAESVEQQLELTSTSFEAWDAVLNDLYDYLSTIMSADDYAAEQANYRQWVAERDQGAANAAQENPDSSEGELAAANFKQSYTKVQCYNMLDKIQ